MGAFGAIMSAEDKTRKGKQPNKGKYRVRVEKMLERSGHNGHFFIVEACVMESVKTDTKEDPTPVGASVSFVMPIGADGNKGKMARTNSKEIVSVLFAGIGYKPEQVSEPLYDEALAKGVMRGVDAYVESFDTTIKSGERQGKEFTGFNWTAIPGQSKDQIKAQRAELGGMPTPAAETPAAKPAAPPPPAAKPDVNLDDLI